MCTFRVDKQAFQEKFSVDFDAFFAAESEPMKYYAGEGMLTNDTNSVNITPLGAVFIRNICMVFDGYLKQQKQELFSRTI